MGSRARLRVVLDREHVHVLGDHPRDGAVVEVDVGHLHRLREGRGVHRKVVVLGADLDGVRERVLDGVVPAVVAELELEGGAPERLAENLVAHADAKGRDLADDVPGQLQKKNTCIIL